MCIVSSEEVCEMVKAIRIVRISKEEAMRRLGDVPEDKRFWSHDGKVIKNLRELGTALNNMSDETFRYHSSDGKADFSKWVRDVVGETQLADDLAKVGTRTRAGRAVAQKVSFLESRM